MEDYVFTYLNQYAEAGGYDERIAFLMGRHMVIDGQAILFINGAVQGKDAEEQEGLLKFSDKSNMYAETMRAKYFDGSEIIGWMQSQPSYGLYLNQRYAMYHKKNFTAEHQVMFVMDPMERLNTFYIQSPDKNAMTEVRGYFIYYDKNANMHEYMLNDKNTEYATPSPAYIETEDAEPAVLWQREEHRENPEEVIRRHAESRRERRTAYKQRRGVNLLAGLSAVLFVVCFLMGAGLIQNQDRISVMEEQLVQLSTAYRNLFTQLSEVTYSPVFAEQDNTAVPVGNNQEQMETYIPADGIPPPGHEPEPAPTPEPTPTPTPEPEIVSLVPETYTIQPGDSLIAISLRFYGDESAVNEILSLNGIENADMIQAGKTIALPVR
jgi:hypothetical protein